MSQFRKLVENILKEHNIILFENKHKIKIQPRTKEQLLKIFCLDEEPSVNKDLEEDTVKQGNFWTNKGKEGTHGTFKTKKQADDQRKAMFANGYKG